MRKRSGSSARGARVAANARHTGRRIDYSDIPESSPEQLRLMRRVGEPPSVMNPVSRSRSASIRTCSIGSAKRRAVAAWGTRR